MTRLKVNLIDGKKHCSKCKELKELESFRKHLQHSTGLRSQCRACERIRNRNTRKRYDNKDKRDAIKKRFLAHYGGACKCCSEDNSRLLTAEHINNDGKKHSNKNGRRYTGHNLYLALEKEGYPDDITVLCFNCNVGSRNNGGICPHKQE